MMDAQSIAQVTDYLKQLRIAVNDAIDVAFYSDPRIDGAINWGDLVCTETAFVVDENGGEYFHVTIQEADPVNKEFCEWIQARLQERGHEAIIVTEW